MKQFTIVLDGIGDRPQKALEGKTPMEAASTPGLDSLFKRSKPGTVLTIPPGLEVGSSVANLNLLGYDPATVYRGRAVIEAAGAGLSVNRGDLYIRCNFISLDGDGFENSVMKSYSAHDIATEKAGPLTDRLNEEVFHAPFRLVHVDTFRNILIVEGAADIAEQLLFMPAHDMIGGRVVDYIKGNAVMQEYFALMKKAYDVLKKDNPTAANGIWFWGASYAPSFGEQPEGRRIVLAETSLMRGIAALSGTECVTTGEDRGFAQFLKDKTKNALDAVRDYDYAYIHIQKLDDVSHELQPVEKTRAIEDIDGHFIRPFFEQVGGPYSAIIVSDHYTFSDSGSHGGDPAPFMLLGHGTGSPAGRFTEQDCSNTGWSITAAELVGLQRNVGK
jgi:2,3-bisphosphoglycerate-independent phosphoglycerate mutase